MRDALEAMSTSRLLDRLRTWSLHHADVAMARDDRVAPEAAVLDRERAVHRWAVPAEWLAGDAAAERSVRESMPRQVRQAGAVGFALTMPGWVAPDGSIWLLDESVDTGALDEVVLVGVGDRHLRELLVGCVRHGRSGGVGPWDRVRLAEPDPVLGQIGRTLTTPEG